MPKHFNTIKIKISDEEKNQRLEDYRYALKYGFYFGPPVDIDDFIKRDIFDESVRFKCLSCGFEDNLEYDILLEMWDESVSDYPILYCNHCSKEKSVPIDVYHKQTLKVFR
jgi:hypothetical protein